MCSRIREGREEGVEREERGRRGGRREGRERRGRGF